MNFWRWFGQSVAWLLASVVLIAVGADLRPWMDGGAFEPTRPDLLWRKLQLNGGDLLSGRGNDNPARAGRECFRKRDFLCAELMLARHLETAAKDSTALGMLAVTQSNLNKHAESIATSEKAFALGEGNFELFFSYAESLDKTGRSADAVKWNYRALSVAPTSFAVRGALVKQLIAQGRPDEALSLVSAYDADQARRGRRPAFTAQRILIEDMVASEINRPRRAKRELKIARLEGHFFAPIKIGNSDYVSFMVDTGATTTTLPRNLLETSKAQAAVLARETEVKLADGRTIKGTRVRLGELRVGQVDCTPTVRHGK